jgi:acetyl esterase/lipase
VVTFLDGGAILGTAPLQSGVATLTTSALTGGSHSISVLYVGNNTFAPSTSASITYQVQRGNATVTLAASKSSTTYGESITFTVSTTPTAPATSAPTGNVSIISDGNMLITVALVNGTATHAIATLGAGVHALTATYAGDSNYNGSATTGSVPVSVAKAPSTLDVQSPVNPSSAGADVQLNISIATPNPVALSGNVIVSEGGQTLAQEAVTLNSFTIAVTGLLSGDHQLLITFSGGDNFEPGSKTIQQKVLDPSLTIADASVIEGNSGTKTVSLLVRLSVRSGQTVAVDYQSQDGTAKAGEDYLGVQGTLTFAPGETAKYVDVTIIGDTTYEDDETFHVILGNPSNATLDGGPATVTILNDDPSFHGKTYSFATVGSTELTLDVDTPVTGSGPYPVIVWVGGASTYAPGGDSPALRETARGYVVVVPAYRAAGQAVFPAQLDDLKGAIRWIRANASSLNVDPKHIGIWGGGAGANLAALVGTTGDAVTGNSLQEGNTTLSSRVQAVVDWAGPADLLLLQSDSTASCVTSYDDASSPQSILIGCPLQTCPAAADAASPQTLVTAGASPILIMHGADDCAVPPEQSRRFYATLKAAGVDATLHIIDGLGAFDASWDASTSHADVDAFLDAHLKGATSKRRGAGH